MRELLIAAPLSFVVGVIVGLGAASRWRIVRRPDPPQHRDTDDEL